VTAGARALALVLTPCFAAIAGCTGDDTVLDLLPSGAPSADAGPDSGPAPPPPMHCMTNANCPDPKKALCRPSDQVCVACLVNTDCMAGTTCDPGKGQCGPGP
jgi:Cys-rich repeat protein